MFFSTFLDAYAFFQLTFLDAYVFRHVFGCIFFFQHVFGCTNPDTSWCIVCLSFAATFCLLNLCWTYWTAECFTYEIHVHINIPKSSLCENEKSRLFQQGVLNSLPSCHFSSHLRFYKRLLLESVTGLAEQKPPFVVITVNPDWRSGINSESTLISNWLFHALSVRSDPRGEWDTGYLCGHFSFLHPSAQLCQSSGTPSAHRRTPPHLRCLHNKTFIFKPWFTWSPFTRN